MTTWQHLAATARAGDRVRFVENWDIFPTALIRAGTTGTVEENSLNEITAILSIRPDDEALVDRLAEWDGCIYLAPLSDQGDAASAHDWQATAPITLTDSTVWGGREPLTTTSNPKPTTVPSPAPSRMERARAAHRGNDPRAGIRAYCAGNRWLTENAKAVGNW